jgi:hypothetical protein
MRGFFRAIGDELKTRFSQKTLPPSTSFHPPNPMRDPPPAAGLS